MGVKSTIHEFALSLEDKAQDHDFRMSNTAEAIGVNGPLEVVYQGVLRVCSASVGMVDRILNQGESLDGQDTTG